MGSDMVLTLAIDRRDTARNIPLRIGNKTELWNKVMKEVAEGRYAGPFEEVPFNYFIQSPIGLVPKDGGKKMRLIFHLSYQFRRTCGKREGEGGESETSISLNEGIPKEWCSVKYKDLDHAIRNSFVWGSTRKPVAYGKTDVTSAFRLVPLNKHS